MSNDASLDDIRRLLPELPGPDLEAGTAALQREMSLNKPAGSLGRLEELAQWMATWQGRTPPVLTHPRIAVFAGSHGVAAHDASALPATGRMVQASLDDHAAINQLARQADADLRVYELDIETPTADFTWGAAMDETGCGRAMAYGMMAVEPGLHLLCLGEMGAANTLSASALCAALFGGDPAEWVGTGGMPEPEGMRRRADLVAKGLSANPGALADPLEALRCLGGFELAAIAGAILAARLARVPVVLDGFACTAAAAVLFKADPRVLDHCLVAHRAAGPAHARLLERIGKAPLFDLGIGLGEGVGAALAIPVLKAALACHTGMGTLGDAGVTRQ